MNESDQAAQMVLRTLALIALGCWAVATAVYGFGDLLNGIDEVRSYRAATHGDMSSGGFSNQLLGLSLLSDLGFFFGTLVGGVGAILGTIQVALAQRGVTWTVGFAVLSLGGVVGAAVISQVRNTSDGFATDYLNWTVLGALALPLIALTVLVGSWVAVRAPEEAPNVLTPSY